VIYVWQTGATWARNPIPYIAGSHAGCEGGADTAGNATDSAGHPCRQFDPPCGTVESGWVRTPGSDDPTDVMGECEYSAVIRAEPPPCCLPVCLSADNATRVHVDGSALLYRLWELGGRNDSGPGDHTTRLTARPIRPRPALGKQEITPLPSPLPLLLALPCPALPCLSVCCLLASLPCLLALPCLTCLSSLVCSQ
jgi:hypothetical protein